MLDLVARAACFALAILLPSACAATTATSLSTLRDLVDGTSRRKQVLADAGQAPIKRHPPGVDVALEARFVAGVDDEPSSYQIEIKVRNEADAVLVFDAHDWWLRDDSGERFTCRAILSWDEELEVWRETDGRIDRGAALRVLTAEFRVPRRYKLEHIIRATMHWGYRLGRDTHRIATGFATR